MWDAVGRSYRGPPQLIACLDRFREAKRSSGVVVLRENHRHLHQRLPCMVEQPAHDLLIVREEDPSCHVLTVLPPRLAKV